MDESVKVQIEAEDEASAKLAAFNANVDKTVGKLKASGEATKKSAELAGTFAAAFGGSELSGFASMLGGVTEKISTFSEMAKNGGTSSLAFKAGLAAVVGVAAFEVGKALGNAIFQVEKWNNKLEESRARFKEIGDATAALQSKQFDMDVEDIELIRDPKEKQAAYKALLDTLNKDLAAVQTQTINSRKATEAWQAAWQITGERKAEAQMAKDQYESDKERQKILLERRQKLLEITSEESQQRELRKEQIKAEEEAEKLRAQTEKQEEATVEKLRQQLEIEKAIGKEKFALQAAQQVSDPARQAEVASLLEQQDALAKQREAEKLAESERQKAAKAEEDRQMRILDIRDKELQKLKEREILLTQGKEASQAFQLETQGLAKDDAAMIAKETERLAALEAEKAREDKVKDAVKEDAKTPKQLQASESRFLRSGGNNPNAKLEEYGKQTAEYLKQLLAAQIKQGNVTGANNTLGKLVQLEAIA